MLIPTDGRLLDHKKRTLVFEGKITWKTISIATLHFVVANRHAQAGAIGMSSTCPDGDASGTRAWPTCFAGSRRSGFAGCAASIAESHFGK